MTRDRFQPTDLIIKTTIPKAGPDVAPTTNPKAGGGGPGTPPPPPARG